jgi:hypothetical protein
VVTGLARLFMTAKALPPARTKATSGMELTTVADVRILVEKHLPKEYRAKFTWRQLAGRSGGSFAR